MPYRYDFHVDRLFRCPEHPERFDSYDITLISNHMIKVEDIDAELKAIAVGLAYQEEIAQKLAIFFVCKATVTGNHVVAGREFKVIAECAEADRVALNSRPIYYAMVNLFEQIEAAGKPIPTTVADAMAEARNVIDSVRGE